MHRRQIHPISASSVWSCFQWTHSKTPSLAYFQPWSVLESYILIYNLIYQKCPVDLYLLLHLSKAPQQFVTVTLQLERYGWVFIFFLVFVLLLFIRRNYIRVQFPWEARRSSEAPQSLQFLSNDTAGYAPLWIRIDRVFILNQDSIENTCFIFFNIFCERFLQF